MYVFKKNLNTKLCMQKSLNYVFKKIMLSYKYGSLPGNFITVLKAPKIISIKIYIPLKHNYQTMYVAK